MTDTTTPVIYKRVTIDGPATLNGLIETIAQISAVAPQTANIVTVGQLYCCGLGDHDEDDPDDQHECDIEPYLSFTVEWEDETEEDR